MFAAAVVVSELSKVGRINGTVHISPQRHPKSAR